MESDRYVVATLLFLIVIFVALAVREYMILENVAFPNRDMILSFVVISILIYIFYKLLVEY